MNSWAGRYIPTGYRFDPVSWTPSCLWNSLKRGMPFVSPNLKARRRTPAKATSTLSSLMNTTDAYATGGHKDKKQLIAKSRQTVQTAEDAREIAVKRIEDNRRASELQASADAQARSQAQADDATRQADDATRQKLQAQADTTRAQADKANAEADRLRAQNDTANAEAARLKAQNDLTNNQAAAADAISAAQPMPTGPG